MAAWFKMTRFKQKIKGYEKIVIYGAGHLAEQLNTELLKNGIFAEYCVVSHKDGSMDTFENMPLYVFDDCISDMQRRKVITLIAVTELYEREIEEVLISHNVTGYLFVTKYIAKSFTFQAYKDKSKQECLDEISEWYVDTNKLEFDDIQITRKRLESIIQEKYYDKDKIVFAVGNLSARVIKFAGALQKKGYKIEILFFPYISVAMGRDFYEQLISIGDSYHTCNTFEELMYYMIVSQAKVAHLFLYVAQSSMLRILIQNKELFPKLVFDEYDIANEMYANISQEYLANEKYCFEYADGLCCRGYEQEYLVNEMNYRIRGKLIRFFDYCNDEVIRKRTKYDSEPLTLCYAGGIATEKEWPDVPYACFLELAEICENNKCHFHVYPSRWDENRFSEYIELNDRSEYFHFHKPVSYEKLRQELSQYDYGVQLLKKGYCDRETVGYYKKNKLIYAACNHFYDYLDAGLPIIAGWPVKLSKYFEKEKVLLNWTIEEYDFDLLLRRRNELRQNVVYLKEKLRVGNKIDELIRFYNSL